MLAAGAAAGAAAEIQAELLANDVMYQHISFVFSTGTLLLHATALFMCDCRRRGGTRCLVQLPAGLLLPRANALQQ
jgi:hypothetical protein